MKKILSFIIAVVMMATLTVGVFAAETETDKNIDVKAEYKDNSTTPSIIMADVSWGAMEFTYTVTGEHKWDAGEHKYDDNTTGNWTQTGNKIEVTNHSNVAVSVTFDLAFEADDEYKDVQAKFSSELLSLPSAEGKGKEADDLKGSTELTLSGKLKSGKTGMNKIGTVTVDIKKATN